MAGDLRAEKNILQNGQMFYQRQLLMNDGNPFALGIAYMARPQRFPGKNNLSLIATVRIYSAKDLHERGFTGAVFAAQRDHFSGVKPQTDIINRLHRTEGFSNVFHFE